MAASAVSAVSAARAPNPIEFIHIPKTGGQAIEAWGLHHGLAWGGCRLKAGGPSWPAHPGKFGSYTRGCSSFHIPPVAWEAAHASEGGGLPFAADAPTFCVVRHPFSRAISEWTWQARWTPYWRTCSADNLNEFIERVFVSGIEPHEDGEEPAEGLSAEGSGAAAGAESGAESGAGPPGPHVPPGIGARLAALRSASELATMDAPPSELDCHVLPQWVYLDGLLPGRPACQHVLAYETLEVRLTAYPTPTPTPDPNPNSDPNRDQEDFAALIAMVGARRGAAASSSPDLAPATAITLDAASPDASGGAAGEPTSETTGGASDDKMREELERLKRMLRHEETYP